jgi:hypothetical protein
VVVYWLSLFNFTGLNLNVLFWHLTDVHADRYFGRYRGKKGHAASNREPTRLTQSGHSPLDIAVPHNTNLAE